MRQLVVKRRHAAYGEFSLYTMALNSIKKKKYLLRNIGLIITAITGSGCAVLAVGAVGAAAGTTAVVATDPRNSGVVVDDNTIETKLRYKYNKNYANANIYVISYNGSLLLTGQVPDKQTAESAVFDAKVMPGVQQIYNYLQVSHTQSLGSKSQDSLTTTQIRTKIIGLDDVSSNSIKVITTDNVVYLFGIVTPDQAKKVSEAAASINGVTKVITLFEYIN